MTLSVAGHASLALAALGLFAQSEASVLQIMVVKQQMLAQSVSGNPACLGRFGNGHLRSSQQLHSPGIPLPAPRTHTPLLVVGKPPPPALLFPAFENVRIMTPQLVGKSRTVESEAAGDLRDVEFEVILVVARGDGLPIFGMRRRSLAPFAAQTLLCGLRLRAYHAVTCENQFAVEAAQEAAETAQRNTAPLADLPCRQVGRNIEFHGLAVFRLRLRTGAASFSAAAGGCDAGRLRIGNGSDGLFRISRQVRISFAGHGLHFSPDVVPIRRLFFRFFSNCSFSSHRSGSMTRISFQRRSSTSFRSMGVAWQ